MYKICFYRLTWWEIAKLIGNGTTPMSTPNQNQHKLEARGGERKLAGLPVDCCWCCCCWCCCCRCCAGRCCAGCSAGAGSSAAAAAAGAGWSAAAAAAAALGMLLLLLPLLRWALQMLGVLQLLGGPAHRAQGGVEPRGGGVHKIDLINYLRFLRCVHPVT